LLNFLSPAGRCRPGRRRAAALIPETPWARLWLT